MLLFDMDNLITNTQIEKFLKNYVACLKYNLKQLYSCLINGVKMDLTRSRLFINCGETKNIYIPKYKATPTLKRH